MGKTIAEHGDRQMADRLQSLLNALPAAVLVLDGRGLVQEANPAARQLLELPLLQRPWAEVVAEAFVPHQGDDLRLHNDRLVTLSTCPLGSEPGQILMLHEVTESRRLQQRLEEHRRLADMGRMAASLAHQIRTPLAAALLYASQLGEPELPDAKRQRFADRTVERLKDLERLVEEVLLFSRGRIDGAQTILAADLVHGLIEELAPWLAQQQVRIAFRDEAPGARISANPTMLRSAVQNLLINAAQLAPDTTVTVAIQRANPGGLDLVVSDRGPGIEKQRLEQIFEPFASDRPGGTGLGLALVRAVARAHHGEAWADSRPGHGSRFAMRLPEYQADSELARVVGE